MVCLSEIVTNNIQFIKKLSVCHFQKIFSNPIVIFLPRSMVSEKRKNTILPFNVILQKICSKYNL